LHGYALAVDVLLAALFDLGTHYGTAVKAIALEEAPAEVLRVKLADAPLEVFIRVAVAAFPGPRLLWKFV
jgi:hypothetical protein